MTKTTGLADDAVRGRPTLAEIKGWPATVDVWHETRPNAAQAIGVSRATAYLMAARGELPTLSAGRRLVVPTAELLRLLGGA